MVLHLDTDDGLKVIMSTRTHGMLSARNFGLILALCVIIRVLHDLTFEYKDTICPYSHVERRFKASDAFFLEKHVVNAPFIRRSRANRYFAGRVQYSVNGASTLQIQRDLLVCGDISSNPEPAKGKDKPKFPCGECSKPVRKNQDAILCSSCDTWSHAKCLKLTVTGFKYYLQHPDLEWTCAFCSLPKLSDSFFDETGSFTLNESNCENEKCEVESVDTDEVLAKIKDIRIEHRKEYVIACLWKHTIVLYYSKACQKCALNKAKGLSEEEFEEWLLEHRCDINFAGSSPAMECEGAVVLWERSPEHHNRDGDSKAFNSIKNVYGAIKVEKLDCVEHVQEKNISWT